MSASRVEPKTASGTALPIPSTVGELRGTRWEQLAGRSVKDEIRTNLIARLRNREPLFPGVLGYQETVTPAVVNALLSRHNFILLGLRGQAKTRILRQLTDLLDEHIPYIEGTELHDDPFQPSSKEGQALLAERGDATLVAWLPRASRYISHLGDERAVHYGLLPRANRGIFAMNELPDLSGKVQVALFNVMQEGDVQIKGYPLRLPLDVLLVFSANPEDYTARGKIITPLKDRIGSEVRTHYPATVDEGMAITRQEAWTARGEGLVVPAFVAEVVEEVAFQARDDARVDKHSGVSQRLPISLLENVVSSAEQRALHHGEARGTARITDLYAALPAVTGKIELEYEGELKGAEAVARDIVRRAIGQVFARRAGSLDTEAVVAYFEADNNLRLPDTLPTAQLLDAMAAVPELLTLAAQLSDDDQAEHVAAAAEFVLEGLSARKLIARSDERGYSAAEEGADRPVAQRWN